MAAKGKLIWRGKEFEKALMDKSRRDVLVAAVYVEQLVKESMKAGGRTESGFLQEGQKPGKVGSFRSKPGEVPRVQTGTLKRSITHWVHPALPVSRAGTNVKYGKWLEFGTPKMEPRPFMRPALEKAKPEIKRIFSKPIRKI